MNDSHHTLSLEQALALVASALSKAGATDDAAHSTAAALVDAQARGLGSHGLSRVPQYVGFLQNGRANGTAKPTVVSEQAATALIDADNGLAFPACKLAVTTAIAKARSAGSCVAAVTNSHHFGVAAWHLLEVAQAGMIGLAMGNSPAAMPVPGGRRALLGTNPLAACFPRVDAAPLIIDLSMSEVARGKIMLAAKEGKPIPSGWAIDQAGNPTTDAKAALAGSMLPLGSGTGSAKGGMLALMIELLTIGLTGAHFGAEADSFFEAEGNQPRLGQCFFVINPGLIAGSETYQSRIEALVSAMLEDETVRLPGTRREALWQQSASSGISIPAELHTQLQAFAQG